MIEVCLGLAKPSDHAARRKFGPDFALITFGGIQGQYCGHATDAPDMRWFGGIFAR